MRAAYALLGVGMVAIGVALYLVVTPAEAPGTSEQPMTEPTFSLSSSAFSHGALIPSVYTCDGENTNPELRIAHAPAGTVSFALIVEDPDIPLVVKERLGVEVFDHYVLYNIPADAEMVPAANTTVGTAGKNTRGDGYTGPCPPPEYEPREHRYLFQLFALNTTLSLPVGATAAELRTAMEGHVIETTFMIGRYERASSTHN